ncbi:hypothetical protein LZ198_16345 [Myxococcus sp. K15C18031901]|uniref:hypothetical protein n=1 Tax=Myxococcus dinghuensis TaxID=2906761 RepID=UPI0020A7CA82|nr:hypothetical protein [Myxococcus dinghuensis]MCP3100441.1 hypothetical protein [Myxococcus dinghuensis]
MRASVVVLLPLLLTACAAPQVRPEGAIRKVVVVASSRVDSLPTSTYREDMMGEGNPRTVIVGQTAAVLRERGFDVVGTRISQSPSPSIQEVVSFLQENQAEAAVVIMLSWVDVSALQALGRAEVVMDTAVIAPNGGLQWRNETRTVSTLGLYQSQMDFRSYLRKAIIEAVNAVP